MVPTENPDFKQQWIFRTSRSLEPQDVLSLITSVEHCNFTPDFSNYSIFQTNISFCLDGLRNRNPAVVSCWSSNWTVGIPLGARVNKSGCVTNDLHYV